MHAVDTNVVVRYVTNDDPVQSPIARRFIDDNEVRVTWTVLLETEWVLRSAHKLTRDRIRYIFLQFAGLPTVLVDAAPGFHAALEWFARGIDLADAMHLASCAEDEAFATFDRKLANTASKLKAGKVRAL